MGTLDFYECEATCPISFQICWFEKMPNLRRGHFRSVSFRGSRTPGLDAVEALIRGSLILNEGFRSDGPVAIQFAKISGVLACEGGQFKNYQKDGTLFALSGWNAEIGENVLFLSGFRAEGQVALRSANIGGNLSCTGGKFLNRNDSGTSDALNATRAKIRGEVSLSDNFFAEGRVWLRGAEIGGDLNCSKGKIVNRTDDGQGTALDTVGAKIGGNVFLSDEFAAEGRVWLRGAEIGGDLVCSNGTITNRTGDGKAAALEARGAKIVGYLLLNNNFAAEGGVVLSGAEIGQSLICSGGKFANRTGDGNGDALDAEGAKIGGTVFLSDEFAAEGRVWLRSADIGGDLQCSNGKITNFTEDGVGCALYASGVHVKSSIFLGKGFHAQGKVDLLGARIERQLSCAGGSFSNPAPEKTQKKQIGRAPLPTAEIALQLQEIKVGDFLFLGPPDNEPDQHVVIRGSLSLIGAYCKQLSDHPKSWPPKLIQAPAGNKLRCYIDLDGFVSDRLTGNVRIDASTRKDWLHRQPPDDLGSIFSAQPYANFVRLLRQMGHDRDARLIAADGEEFRRQEWNKTTSWIKWLTLGPFWWLFGRLVGYGYHPGRMLFGLLVIWLGCALFYDEAAVQGVMAPSQPSIFLKFDDCRSPNRAWSECITQKAPEYTTFNAYVYSADLMLPIIDLQQKRAWAPMWQKMNLQLPAWVPWALALPAWAPWALVWIETIFGWVASLVLAAVLSRNLIRRDQS